MADGPKDYRDPKVTNTDKKGGGAMKWVWIILAIILALLILGWLLDWFGSDEVVGTTEAPVVMEEGAAPEEGTVIVPE